MGFGQENRIKINRKSDFVHFPSVHWCSLVGLTSGGVPVVQNEPHLTKHVQAALSLRRRHRGGANTAPLKA